MTTYAIRLPDGRVAQVPMPTHLTVKRAMPDDKARAAISRYVAKHTAQALEPVLKPRGPWKEVVRDEQGQIVKLVEHAADPPAAETAAELGRQAAELYVSEIEGW